jgi:uncharacterized membrane protein
MTSSRKYSEKTSRSLVKALTFRAVILVADTVIIYGITKRADVTAGVVLLSNISSTILYFLHERVWNGVHWGKYHKK